MASKSERPKRRDRVLSALGALILALNLAKDTCGIPPAQIAFASASALLEMIRDSMANRGYYVELGKSCAGVCEALDRGLNGRRLDNLSQSVLSTIEELTTAVAEIQRNFITQGERSKVSRLFRSKNNDGGIVAWRQDLNGILQIFNTELSQGGQYTTRDHYGANRKIRTTEQEPTTIQLCVKHQVRGTAFKVPRISGGPMGVVSSLGNPDWPSGRLG